MTITEIAVHPSYRPSANMGRAMCLYRGLLYVSADNAMDQSPAGDYRPSGIVCVVQPWRDGEIHPSMLRVIDNPHPTGRPNISNAAAFTDRDGMGFALAACDVGVLIGVPFHDGNSTDTRNNVGQVLMIDGTFPAIPMPPGAMLGYSLAAEGNVIVAGAPGAQQAIVYTRVGGQWRVQVLRPPWLDSYFGMRVKVSNDYICVSSDTHEYCYHLQSAFYGWTGLGIGSPVEAAYTDDRSRSAWHINGVLTVLGLDAAAIELPTPMPPQFVPIVWLSNTVLAVGDAMGNGGSGCVRFYEVTE